MKRVACILDHFRFTNCGSMNGCCDSLKQLGNRVCCLLVICSNYREWRIKKIGNCCGFTHKFRIHTNLKVSTAFFARMSLQPRNDSAFQRARQDGAPDNNDELSGRALKPLADLAYYANHLV